MSDNNARQAGLTAAEQSFADEMEGLQYGIDETANAKSWFMAGWISSSLAAHSADARNGEGVALAQEMRWRDVSVEKPTQAQQVLFVRNGKVHFGAWINDIFWYSNEKVCALYWMPLPEAPTLAAPAAPAPKCTRCEYIGKCDCEPAPAPAAQADERELGLYDEIECDLPALFGRASTEGHEAGQALAAQLQAKMRKARQQSSTPADSTSGADKRDAERYQLIKRSGLILSGGYTKFDWPISPFGDQCDKYLDAVLQRERQQGDKS